MKTIFAAAVASVAILSAAPALAQGMYGPPPPGAAPAPRGWELDRRLDWMQQRIDRGRADGSLDWRESRRVQRELIHIRHDEDRLRYRNGGRLSDRDRFMLQDRLDRLSDQIRWMRHNEERRPW
jgi:hypothetical protein